MRECVQESKKEIRALLWHMQCGGLNLEPLAYKSHVLLLLYFPDPIY